MKAKSLTLMIASVFSLILLVGLASAAISISSVPTLSQSGSSFTFDVSSNETETVTLTAETITSGSKSIVFTPIVVSLDNNASSVTMDYNASNFNFEFGESYSTTLLAQGDVSPDNATATLNFADSSYCRVGNTHGNIVISIEDINILEGFGDEDDYWYPQDEVEIEIEVANDGGDDIDNIEVEWALYTQDGKKIIDGDESDFDLKDDKEETITITFLVEADELDEDTEDYVFHVRATGEDTDHDDEEVCDADSQNIDIKIDDDFVVVSELDMPESVSCGETFTISGEVWNVGEDNQDDVVLDIYNQALGIQESLTIGDIDAFESEDFELTVTINGPVQKRTHYISFAVYDDSNDIYENSEDDKSDTRTPLTISETCEAALPQDEVSVSASLTEAKEGEQAIVMLGLSNLGDELGTYTVNVVGYGDWATSASLSKTAAVVSAGSSDTIDVTFDLKSGVSGEQTFEAKILSGGIVVLTQPVSFTIEAEPSVFGEDWYLWLIGIANVILVLIIIIVAIKIARS